MLANVLLFFFVVWVHQVCVSFLFCLFFLVRHGGEERRESDRDREPKKNETKQKRRRLKRIKRFLSSFFFFSFVVGMAADWIVSRAPTNQSASSASFTSDACKHVPLADAALSFFFCFFLEIGNRGNSTFLSFVFVFCFSFRLFGFPNNNNNNGDQFFFVFIVIVFFVRRSSLR